MPRSQNHLILSPPLSRGEGIVSSIAPLPRGEAGVWDELVSVIQKELEKATEESRKSPRLETQDKRFHHHPKRAFGEGFFCEDLRELWNLREKLMTGILRW